MAPVLSSRTTEDALSIQGFLTEATRPLTIAIKTEPLNGVYDVEPRPFARGKFAQVRRCTHKDTGIAFAAKFMKKRRRANDVRHEILHEIRVLLTSESCEKIVSLYEVYETWSEIILILEMVEGGELQRVLDEDDSIPEVDCKRMMRQILEGVQFLHRANIAHLDIKPQNLLLTRPFPDGDVKLCDFGISRVLTTGAEIREIVGTPDYVAPEILQFEPISLATDMWSIGILTYALISGHSPFGGDSKQETYCNITNGNLDFPQFLFNGISEAAKDFIRKLLVKDPKSRMNCQECLEHEWLRIETNECNSKVPLTNSPIISSCRQSTNGEDENESAKKERKIRKILSPSSINSTLICTN